MGPPPSVMKRLVREFSELRQITEGGGTADEVVTAECGLYLDSLLSQSGACAPGSASSPTYACKARSFQYWLNMTQWFQT